MLRLLASSVSFKHILRQIMERSDHDFLIFILHSHSLPYIKLNYDSFDTSFSHVLFVSSFLVTIIQKVGVDVFFIIV